MSIDTHLMGSDRGYGQLAASPGVSPAESDAIAGLDLGLPAGGRADRLDQQLVVYCRSLPGGRIALTRCMAGGIDDVGRQTTQFRTLIMARTQWVCEVRHGLHRVLTDPALWKNPAFEAGTPLSLAVNATDQSPPSQAAVTLAFMIRAGPRPILIKADATTNATLLSMVSTLSDADAADLCWGLGLGRVCAGLDVATVVGGASLLGQPLRTIGHPSKTDLDRTQATALPRLRDPAEPTPPSDSGGGDGRSRPPSLTLIGWLTIVLAGTAVVLGTGWLLGAWPAGDPQPEPTGPPVAAEVLQTDPVRVLPAEIPVEPVKTVRPAPVTVLPSQSAASVHIPRPESPPPAEPAVRQDISPSATAVPVGREDPAGVAERLDRLHKSVIALLIPAGTPLGDGPSRTVIGKQAAAYLESVWNPEEGSGDPMAYLCVLSEVDAHFDIIDSILNEDGLKRWGAPPPTSRWLRSAGRNEDQIGRRMRALESCKYTVVRIERTARALGEILSRQVVDAACAAVRSRWFESNLLDAMALKWECVWRARHLVDSRLQDGWPREPAMELIGTSYDLLKSHRGDMGGKGGR
jgi:hypothetical protein